MFAARSILMQAQDFSATALGLTTAGGPTGFPLGYSGHTLCARTLRDDLRGWRLRSVEAKW